MLCRKMSSRQFRRRDKQNNFPPPPPDDSDDDYQPLYTKKSGFSNYAGVSIYFCLVSSL